MKITKAKKLAERLLVENKIFGWKIFFSNVRTVAAITWHDDWAIECSKPFFVVNNYARCKDVILHEAAHALVGLEAHHNSLWQEKCVKIGAIPKEFIDDDDGIPYVFPMEHINEQLLFMEDLFVNNFYNCQIKNCRKDEIVFIGGKNVFTDVVYGGII